MSLDGTLLTRLALAWSVDKFDPVCGLIACNVIAKEVDYRPGTTLLVVGRALSASPKEYVLAYGTQLCGHPLGEHE